MQLYIVNWSFQNAEDQLFATNEFCEYLEDGRIHKSLEGFELNFMAHTPQNGTGIIICKAQNASILLRIFAMWRKNYSITFNFKPALTNDELLLLHSEECFWKKD